VVGPILVRTGELRKVFVSPRLGEREAVVTLIEVVLIEEVNRAVAARLTGRLARNVTRRLRRLCRGGLSRRCFLRRRWLVAASAAPRRQQQSRRADSYHLPSNRIHCLHLAALLVHA